MKHGRYLPILALVFLLLPLHGQSGPSDAAINAKIRELLPGVRTCLETLSHRFPELKGVEETKIEGPADQAVYQRLEFRKNVKFKHAKGGKHDFEEVEEGGIILEIIVTDQPPQTPLTGELKITAQPINLNIYYRAETNQPNPPLRDAIVAALKELQGTLTIFIMSAPIQPDGIDSP